MKNKIIGIGIILILAILAGVGYSRIRQRTQAPPPALLNTNTVSENIVASGSPTTVTNNLRGGGNVYKDPQGIYTFSYPSDYTVAAPNGDQYTRISKRGATQQGQTEMYDGVIMVFESVNLQGKSLENWVDSRIQESTADGTSAITQPKRFTTVNGYPGFMYTTRGLGLADYIVLQKNTSSKNAISIAILVSDPEDLGYQNEVASILETLELLK